MAVPNEKTPLDPVGSSGGGAGVFTREPILTANVVVALILEVCVLLRAFGVPLTDAQQNAIIGVAAAVFAIGAGLIARRYTTPLADPRNDSGENLVAPPTSNGAHPPQGGSPTAG